MLSQCSQWLACPKYLVDHKRFREGTYFICHDIVFKSPSEVAALFFCFFNSTNLIFSKAWCRPVVGAVSQSVGRKRGREERRERRHLPKQWDTFSRDRDRGAAFLPSIRAFLPIPTSPISLCSFSYGNCHVRHPLMALQLHKVLHNIQTNGCKIKSLEHFLDVLH